MDPALRLARCFAQNLALARERAGLSQEELGFRASLHRTEVGQLERGARLPRIDTIVKLSGALGVEPGDLLGGLAWRPGEPVSGTFEVEEPEP